MNHSKYQTEVDETDLQILHHLVENAARSNKEIGTLVHLSGQAVGLRIRKLQDMGVIEGYTLRCNTAKLGQQIQAFVTLYMNSASGHSAFLAFVKERQWVQEVHRISGEGCYWMRVHTSTMAELNTLMEQLLPYGNFKISLSIEQCK